MILEANDEEKGGITTEFLPFVRGWDIHEEMLRYGAILAWQIKCVSVHLPR